MRMNLLKRGVGLALSAGVVFIGGCTADSDLLYLNDKVNKVEQRLGAVEQGMRKQSAEDLTSVRKSVADQTVEIERLKRELEAVKTSLEETKARRLSRVETSQQGLLSRVSDLEADMAQVRGHLKLEIRSPITDQRGLSPELHPVQEPKDIRQQPIKESQQRTTPAQPAPEAKQQEPPPSVASVAPGTTKASKHEQDPLEQGIDLYKKGNTKEAIAMFDNVLKSKGKEEKKPEAYYWMAESYMTQKDYEKAILTYQDLIKNYPQSPRIPNALLRQAEAFSEIKDTMSAIILLRQVIKKYPGTQEAKIAEKRVQELEKKKK